MKSRRTGLPGMDEAEHLALVALRFLAADAHSWSGFEAMSGISPEMVQEMAGERGFLAGVLDYLLCDDSLLLSFCGNAGLAPQDIVNARHVLAGESSDMTGGL